MNIVCPSCGGEHEIADAPDHDPADACVRVERVTCPHCQLARTVFVRYPHFEHGQ
jgi:rubredoxin